MIAPAKDTEKHEPTPAFTKKANELISHYPVSKRSGVLPLLHLWQETFGYISEEAVEWIAGKLELQKIHVLEVVTFYPMFREHAIGTYHIKVCRTLSCELGGAYETFNKFVKSIGKTKGADDHGVSSKDGKFTVEFVECLASCGAAPVVMVNEDFYENVTPNKVKELVAKYE
ncbi:MAG: NAD(P)H-dependent oxidoreductase subunit E [Verrucomicrobiota bacterium]